jgi:hypothetical protein
VKSVGAPASFAKTKGSGLDDVPDDVLTLEVSLAGTLVAYLVDRSQDLIVPSRQAPTRNMPS